MEPPSESQNGNTNKTFTSEHSLKKNWVLRSQSGAGSIRVTECRVYHAPLPQLFNLISNCKTYQDWFPTTYPYTIIQCPHEKTGTLLKFEPNEGQYETHIDTYTENESITISFGNGILEGMQHWSLKPLTLEEVQKMEQEANPEDSTARTLSEYDSNYHTQICYDIDLTPASYGVSLIARVVSNDYLKSYFTPLLDAVGNFLERERQERAEMKEMREATPHSVEEHHRIELREEKFEMSKHPEIRAKVIKSDDL